MAFCPKCRYEYQPQIAVCPDCQERLVAGIAPPVQAAAVAPDDSWVVVGKVGNEYQSEMAKGSLDSGNIPSMILSSNFSAYGKGVGSSNPLTLSIHEGIVVMVPREFKEEATLLLEGVLGEDFYPADTQ
jgi:hypothetical protein